VSADDVPSVETSVGLDRTFEVTGHHITFYGVCSECREEGADS